MAQEFKGVTISGEEIVKFAVEKYFPDYAIRSYGAKLTVHQDNSKPEGQRFSVKVEISLND